MTVAKTATSKLPKGILASDLKRPSWHSKVKMAHPEGDKYGEVKFELVRTTAFGWCISTLLIAKASGRRSSAPGGDRTYAVRCNGDYHDGETVRIGFGPHVTFRGTVYVKASRAKALAKYLGLLGQGAVRANEIRDRISSRRAQSAMRRNFW